jgi:sugar lactone lactonase YvrE
MMGPISRRVIFFAAFATSLCWTQTGHPLKEIYRNDDFQFTGVTMARSGRLFVNFPRWSDLYRYAVIDVGSDGTTKPFPDEQWNHWDRRQENAGKQFVCVQSVVIDKAGMLWVLDPAAPFMGPVVPGGPKLVGIDLRNNKVSRIIPFGPEVVKAGSYLNDVRFDNDTHTAYITDSGVGGIVVVDMESGKARRVLDGDPSVQADQNIKIVVDGKPVLAGGKPLMINTDSVALSPDAQYLYFKPLTGDTLYRVRTELFRDPSVSPSQLSQSVEKVAKVFPTDGFWMDTKGNLYLSNINRDGISRRSPDGKIEEVASDPRLQWPDTFTEGPDGTIYISASHINESPMFNQGKSTRKQPYAVFAFKP